MLIDPSLEEQEADEGKAQINVPAVCIDEVERMMIRSLMAQAMKVDPGEN